MPGLKRLRKIFDSLSQVQSKDRYVALKDRAVLDITDDSRKVKKSSLFIAYKGVAIDGNNFIDSAIKNGAIGIVCEREGLVQGKDIPFVVVENGRRALAEACACFYNYPSEEMVVIGVTGTDGKTTTGNIIYEILKSSGLKAGILSTVNARIGDKEIDTGFHVTTSDADDLQKILRQMADSGTTHCILETTSHALDQHRVDAINYDIAVVTNITTDHLDYHKTREAYREAKGMLFKKVVNSKHKSSGTGKTFILNADDEFSFEYLKNIATGNLSNKDNSSYLNESSGNEYSKVNCRCYSLDQSKSACVTAQDIKSSAQGMSFAVVDNSEYTREKMTVSTNFIGGFNVYNILASILTARSLGISDENISTALRTLNRVSGRMEVVDKGQDFLAVIDFAHTPNSMQNALETVKKITKGKLICVFGCAGERDSHKRPIMGKIASRLCNVLVLTAEDPRTEEVSDIIAQIEPGLVDGKSAIYKETDRRKAIELACSMAQKGDTVILLGKGHEKSMCFGKTEFPWNEREVLELVLDSLG